MNQLRRSKITKCLCIILMLAVITPAGITVSPSPAHAQATTMAVGVVDFANQSGVQGDLLSRLATDAVVVEMSKRFDIITRSQLQQQMDLLGLRPPLSSIGLVRLGEQLNADAMVEGAITSVQISGQGANRRASVTLAIRLLDQASGEALNGAIQTGYSNPRVGQAGDDDTLITEAIENAAYLSVKTMTEYIIPEATVQSTIGENEVMLNRGSRDGMKRGMRMLVSRDREIIGYLQIKSVSPNDALAVVTKAMRGVRPEDKAKAIFDMPSISRGVADSGKPAGAPSAQKKVSSLWKSVRTVVLGVAALYAGTRLFKSEGVESVGTATAEATADNSGQLAVEVRWDPKSLQRGKNVIEYHLYRNYDPDPVAVASPSQGRIMDYVRNVPVDVNFMQVNNITNTAVSTSATVQPLQPGTSVTYYISAVYVSDVKQSGEGSGGETTTRRYYETERALAGQATPIQRITGDEMRISSGVGDIEDPSNVDLRRVTFSWRSKRGADWYMIEVSENSSFTGSVRYWELPSPVESNPLSDGVWVSKLVVQQLQDVFNNPSRQTLYWRVGARNSGDNPGPKPPVGRPGARWIYSEPQSFTTVEAPPPPPI